MIHGVLQMKEAPVRMRCFGSGLQTSAGRHLPQGARPTNHSVWDEFHTNRILAKNAHGSNPPVEKCPPFLLHYNAHETLYSFFHYEFGLKLKVRVSNGVQHHSICMAAYF